MPLSPTAKIAMLAQETSEREICLLTITHPEFEQPVYLSTDATVHLRDDDESGTPIYGTRSRGIEFIFVPIAPILPSSDSETPPAGRFSISNVSRIVAPYLLKVNERYPRVTIEVVMASDPDTVNQIWPDFDLTSASIDATNAEVQVSLNTASSEPMPYMRFTPAHFPNLFM